MQIKTTPMRTVTYLGVDVQIPAHHTAVAADGCGQVYSYAFQLTAARRRLDISLYAFL